MKTTKSLSSSSTLLVKAFFLLKIMKSSFYVIQDWMISKLNLKSNDLLIYAIIYGFSQDQNTLFRGSINYLCKMINASRSTVIKTLKKLVENELIIKLVEERNNVIFNNYFYNPNHKLLVQKSDRGSVKTELGVVQKSDGGSVKTEPNNIIDNINNNINNNIVEEKFEILENSKVIIENENINQDYVSFYNKIINHFPERIIPKTKNAVKKWIDCIRLLVEKDNYSLETIEKIIIKFRADTFWCNNFMSFTKLRDKNRSGVMYVDYFNVIMSNTPKKQHDLSRYDASEFEKNKENPNRLDIFSY